MPQLLRLRYLLFFVCFLFAGVGQVPRVGQIILYGARKTPEARILHTLQVKQGDPLPPSKGEIEDRLEKLPGVVVARLEAVCCEAGKAVLFVGVEEKGAPHFELRSEPQGSERLPDDMVETYQAYLRAVEAAARTGSTAEDLTAGHPLMANRAVRDLQEQFLTFAKDRLKNVRDVLRNSSDPGERAMAATIIGYAPKKDTVLNDLTFAMQDPDEAVRANAMRALGAMAVLAAKRPDLGLQIPATWFVEMLNSIVLSDRYRAALALVNLTEKNGQEMLAQIRERALPAVLEMARWDNLRYALPAYILAGRVAGLSEADIEASWSRGEREMVIGKLAPAHKH